MQRSGLKLVKDNLPLSEQIIVKVTPIFVEEESTPEQESFVWAYNICITNHSDHPTKLLRRAWKIIDADGISQEISGEGVLGKTPTIPPRESHEYSSGVELFSPSGVMSGHYTMEDEFGNQFDVKIPAFSLDSPYQPVSLN